jgi:hypothetical protein
MLGCDGSSVVTFKSRNKVSYSCHVSHNNGCVLLNINTVICLEFKNIFIYYILIATFQTKPRTLLADL